jgi:hypothetical protein
MADHRAPLRGPVGWGDALTAAGRLGLTAAEHFDVLVELLGLGTATPGVPAVAADQPPRQPAVEPGTSPAPWTMPPAETAELRTRPGRQTTARELEVEPVEPVEFGLEPPLDPAPSGQPAVPYEPPIPANQLRAALTMLVRRPRLSDDVDLEAAVALVAEQRPFVQLPRLIEQSTGLGATVIADVGAGMLPYLDDVVTLVAEAGQVVGEPQLEVDWVDDDAWRDHRVPAVQTERPTLVVSTLGAVHPPSALPGAQARWLVFADAAREAGADVVALVPHRRLRWPGGLDQLIRLVAWDDLADAGRGRG